MGYFKFRGSKSHLPLIASHTILGGCTVSRIPMPEIGFPEASEAVVRLPVRTRAMDVHNMGGEKPTLFGWRKKAG